MTEPISIPDDDLEIALLQMTFEATDPELLLPVLSKYIVMTRKEAACRNADLCVSFTDPSRFWSSRNGIPSMLPESISTLLLWSKWQNRVQGSSPIAPMLIYYKGLAPTT